MRGMANAAAFGWWKAIGWGSIAAVAMVSQPCCEPGRLASDSRGGPSHSVLLGHVIGFEHALAMIEHPRRVRGTTGWRPSVAACRPRSPTCRCCDLSTGILNYDPLTWVTHVSGHPPGVLLTFVWLDRIKLSGGAWAGAFVAAGRVERGNGRDRRGARRVRQNRPPGWPHRSSPWPDRDLDCRLRGRVPARIAWVLPCWPWQPARTVRYAFRPYRLLLAEAIFLNYGLVLIGLLALAALIAVAAGLSALASLAAAVPAAVAVAVAFAVVGLCRRRPLSSNCCWRASR